MIICLYKTFDSQKQEKEKGIKHNLMIQLTLVLQSPVLVCQLYHKHLRSHKNVIPS
jgi:hypothetical protein